MSDLTLGYIGELVAFIAGLIGGLAYLNNILRKWLGKFIEDQLGPINNKLDSVSKSIDSVDMENCKNFLVQCLSDFDKGVPDNEIEVERFWEQYKHYVDKGGNTYIKRRVEKLQAEGRL